MKQRTKELELLKPLAIELRLQGKTYKEIGEYLGPISKSTLSGWFKGIQLTTEHKNRIKQIMTEKGHRGRQIGAWANHQKRLDRISGIKLVAKTEFTKFLQEPTFLMGLVLYLAEGSKKHEQFQFMNSDPYLIKIMLTWITDVSPIKLEDVKFRLYIHKQYEGEGCEGFWAERLNVSSSQFQKTIYKPSERVYKKNPHYKGCLRIEISGNELYWKVMAWRDCLYEAIV